MTIDLVVEDYKDLKSLMGPMRMITIASTVRELIREKHRALFGRVLDRQHHL